MSANHPLMWVSIAYVGLAAGASQPGMATFIVSVNNHNSTTLHEITVDRGNPFTVDLVANISHGIYDISMYLEASASSVASMENGSFSGDWAVNSSISLGSLDPRRRLEAQLSYPQHSAPGVWRLAVLNLLVDTDAPPGPYALNVANIMSPVCPICQAFYVASPGPDFQLTVVPEPAGPLIFLLGFALAGIMRLLAPSANTRNNTPYECTRPRAVCPSPGFSHPPALR